MNKLKRPVRSEEQSTTRKASRLAGAVLAGCLLSACVVSSEWVWQDEPAPCAIEVQEEIISLRVLPPITRSSPQAGFQAAKLPKQSLLAITSLSI